MIWAYALAVVLVIMFVCVSAIVVLLGLGEWFSWHEENRRRKKDE